MHHNDLSRRDLLTLIGSALAVPQSQPGEILIRGGRLVNADGIREADLRIVGETIAEIGANLRPGAGARIIEAAGHLVMPGGIDPHTHLHRSFADDLTTGSEAALAGGVTTVGTFAFPPSADKLVAEVERVRGDVSATAIADVFVHGFAWPPTPDVILAVTALAAAGQPSIKLFMPTPDFQAQLSGTIELLEAARAAGVVTMIHCEDNALLGAAARRLKAANRTSFRYYPESRPIVAEVAATQQAIGLCESTRAPMYVVHLSSARALEACRLARRATLPLYVETRPLYLHLTEEKMAGPDAALFVGQPPLRSRADSEALWAGLMDGTIDVLATDHAPWTKAQKLDPALDITNLKPGVSDLQFMLPMYFSEGVGKRRMPLERFVATTATNAARIFGLYPDKGVIRERAAADVVIWDPRLTRTVRAEDDRSRADYSVYEGWQVTGWPVVTIRRGQIVLDAGRVTGAPGTGRLVTRTPWRHPN